MQNEWDNQGGGQGYGGQSSHGGQGGYGGGRGGGGGGGRRDGRESYGGGGGGRRDSGERRGTPLSELDPALTSVSHKVIGCARDVHMALGPGFSRESYFNALKGELDAAGVGYKANHKLDVKYKDQVVGHATADLLVGDRFIVTVLAQDAEVSTYQRVELRAQLKAADVELGLIINFAGKLLKDGLVRVLNPGKLEAARQAAAQAGGAAGGAEPDAPIEELGG